MGHSPPHVGHDSRIELRGASGPEGEPAAAGVVRCLILRADRLAVVVPDLREIVVRVDHEGSHDIPRLCTFGARFAAVVAIQALLRKTAINKFFGPHWVAR